MWTWVHLESSCWPTPRIRHDDNRRIRVPQTERVGWASRRLRSRPTCRARDNGDGCVTSHIPQPAKPACGLGRRDNYLTAIACRRFSQQIPVRRPSVRQEPPPQNQVFQSGLCVAGVRQEMGGCWIPIVACQSGAWFGEKRRVWKRGACRDFPVVVGRLETRVGGSQSATGKVDGIMEVADTHHVERDDWRSVCAVAEGSRWKAARKGKTRQRRMRWVDGWVGG